MKKLRTFTKILGVVVLVGAIILFAAGNFLVSVALQPEDAIAHKNANSYEYMMAEYPHIQAWYDDLVAQQRLQETTMEGVEGETLYAYYAKADVETDKTAIIVHGYTDNALRMMMIGYLYHHELGYNILLPDLHHHGKSEGDAIRMGWLDRLDVAKWSEEANRIFGRETRQVVHGISMGAATTMMLSGEEQRGDVKCFVEDCGYTSVWDQFAKELKEDYGLPAFPLLNIASWICDWKYGWTFKEASAVEAVRRCHLPMLFIHGDADKYVPTEMVHPLYEAKSGDKELWLVKGAEHAASYHDYPEEYTQRVRQFVEQYLE